MIETKMDPLAASFAAMEEPPHEEASPHKEDAQSPAEKVAEHIAAVKQWMDAHTVIAARPALAELVGLGYRAAMRRLAKRWSAGESPLTLRSDNREPLRQITHPITIRP